MASIRIHRHAVATLADGSDLALHLHEISGDADGPTLGLCAAIHGNEPTGTLIVHRVLETLATESLAGRLLALPVANPPAFVANSRHSPLDDQNLNRLFPGNPDGWVSEQLAHHITERFLTQVDVLIDLHSGGDRPTVDYVYIKNTENLSRHFGSPVLYQADPTKAGTLFSGTSNSVTESRGVPTVTVELGGGLVDQTPYVDRGVRGVLNILRSLEMLSGDVAPLPKQRVVDRIETIRPHHGGFLVTEAPMIGLDVEKHAVLGKIVSPYTGDELEVIQSPVDNGIVILSHLTTNVVQPGDYAYMIGSG